MTRSRQTALAAASALFLAAAAALSEKTSPYFLLDGAEEVVATEVFENAELYDGGVASSGGSLWISGLEFVPGQGDHAWIGRRAEAGWAWRRRVTRTAGRLSAPRLAAAGGGGVWLTYEAESDGQWDVVCVRVDPTGETTEPRVLSVSRGPDIRHRSAAAPDGSLWVVWQSEAQGQFDVVACRVGEGGAEPPERISEGSAGGDWHPDVAVDGAGDVHVVWDVHSGGSFDVHLRARRGGAWGETLALASGPGFEGRASIAARPGGGAWVLWEEGGENWGHPYVPAMHRNYRGEMRIRDSHGPLHRFRRLHLVGVDGDGTVLEPAAPLPAPAFELAARRPGLSEDSPQLGAFYERGRLELDQSGGLWVFYRHFYVPGLGTENRSHQEEGWGLYARRLGESGWSRLHRFEVGQGDGMQSLELTPHGESVAAVWTTGRTDRRPNDRPRGLALGFAPASADGAAAGSPAAPLPTVDSVAASGPNAAAATVPRPAVVRGTEYHLFFGDLHRHTDLSLCRVPSDGTIDDAYRYAAEVARLDFLGITDHSRDIALGNPLSQLWWRSTKEVLRHDLQPRFLPLYAYERSRGREDHNVISLHADRLRPHTYPHPEFWKELGDDTLTIPHQTATDPIPEGGPMPLGLEIETWSVRDDTHRPLLEIYQGCRDRSIERDAHEGLSRGHLLGFIASSDHQSTAASYACVWAEERTRESIFRALQARRTFGATARIRLSVRTISNAAVSTTEISKEGLAERAGGHFMGELFEAAGFPPVEVEVDGTATVDALEVVIDGKTVATLPGGDRVVRRTYAPATLPPGRHYLYVIVHQHDGHRAWSSPLWVDVPQG